MSKFNYVLVAASIALPLSLISVSAQAATAHNLQNGTSTSNTTDTMGSANMKQGMMMKKMKKHHMMMHKSM